MKLRLLPLILIILALVSCQFRRSNPLDPIGNPDVSTPQTISNLIVYGVSGPGADNKYVELRWDANNPLTTDGYFVYRGLAYNSSYAPVDTVGTNSCYHGSKPWHLVLSGIYWYKVSAYKDIYKDPSNPTPANYLGRLEGRLSEARPVVVPA
ncbi:MAG TPA: hypothetical protein PKH19_04665 [Candidatus Syntrophosphaera sp.]|nr:hypothetical protein [Candidatus Syntrophosphaera sp.]